MRRRLAPLADRRVLAALGRTFVVFVGVYLPYTYFSAVYAPATGGSGELLAALLLVFGVAATAGNLAAGALADRLGPRRVIAVVTLLLAVVFAVVPALRGSLLPAVIAVVVSGVLSFSLTTPRQDAILAIAPDSGTLVTSLHRSTVYLAISASGVVGAIGLDLLGATLIAPRAAVVVLASAVPCGPPSATVSHRGQPHRPSGVRSSRRTRGGPTKWRNPGGRWRCWP